MKTEDKTVTWTWPLGEFTSIPEINVTVTYKVSAPKS
jgi:hypothetical protein